MRFSWGWSKFGGWNNTSHAIKLPNGESALVPRKVETGRRYGIRAEVQGASVKCWLDGRLMQQASW